MDAEIVDDVPGAFATLVALERPAALTLSGGGTAERCYAALAREGGVDWEAVDVLIGDERWVPVDDEDSNEGMARRVLLDRVPVAAVHSMRDAGRTIDGAADVYDALVRARDDLGLVHLGLGPDGHTASLFPGSGALDVEDRMVVATGDGLHPHPRLTLTFPAIERARLVVFTVEGEDKREAFARVRGGENLPAARVRAPRVKWLVDPAVAQ